MIVTRSLCRSLSLPVRAVLDRFVDSAVLTYEGDEVVNTATIYAGTPYTTLFKRSTRFDTKLAQSFAYCGCM